MLLSKLKTHPHRKQKKIKTLNKGYAEGSDERKALYGDKNPDYEEFLLNRGVSAAESAEKKARDQHNEMQQKWNTSKANIKSLKKRIDHREPELRILETEFFESLEPIGFSNEEQLLEARLPSGRRNELTAKAKELDECQRNLKTSQKAIVTQKKECRRWENLHKLIGSLQTAS